MGAEIALAVKAATDITKEAMNCFKEYAMCREQEVTERKRIRAQLQAVNHWIDANKEIYLKQIETGAEERKMMYKAVEGVIEKATKEQDLEMLKLAMNFMLTVYQKAPELGQVNIQMLEQKNIL